MSSHVEQRTHTIPGIKINLLSRLNVETMPIPEAALMLGSTQVRENLQAGLAPANMKTLLKQRMRWVSRAVLPSSSHRHHSNESIDRRRHRSPPASRLLPPRLLSNRLTNDRRPTGRELTLRTARFLTFRYNLCNDRATLSSPVEPKA